MRPKVKLLVRLVSCFNVQHPLRHSTRSSAHVVRVWDSCTAYLAFDRRFAPIRPNARAYLESLC